MADLEERVNISTFTRMTLKDMRELDKILLVEEYNGVTSKPLAAVIPYGVYMHMQALILSAGMREKTT